MKIVVTGGCGFLGSHVCERFRKCGNEVVAFDNLTKFEYTRSGYNTDAIRDYNRKYLEAIGVYCHIGDIGNVNDLYNICKDADYLIHTAAQPAMTISIEEPGLDIRTNVMGTFNVLETARKYDIPIVSCSSIHVYGNKINESLSEEPTRFTRKPPTIDEEFPTLQGNVSPLHASKRSAEIYVQSYIDTYGLKAATFRFTGMYGPRQFGGEDHGWVANFTIRTLAGLPIRIFGTDKQVRDILYVSDAAAAFEAFYQHQEPGLYNIGGGEENIISIRECISAIRTITGISSNVTLEPYRFGDLYYFVSNITKAKTQLEWAPSVGPAEGLEKLIEWVRSSIHLFR